MKNGVSAFKPLVKQGLDVTVADILIALAGSFFIALCSQISIPLPFTLVPLTLQPHAVLLVAAILGKKRAFLALSAYLLEGALGAPVFTYGRFGWIHLFGATGGYLMSYLIVSYLAGEFFEKDRFCSRFRALLFFLGGISLILSCGFLWLSCFVGFKTAWTIGVTPFLITGVLKSIILASFYPQIMKGALRIRQR